MHLSRVEADAQQHLNQPAYQGRCPSCNAVRALVYDEGPLECVGTLVKDMIVQGLKVDRVILTEIKIDDHADGCDHKGSY